MGPADKRAEVSESLNNAIKDAFGSLEEIKKQFGNAAAGRFGSGWAWLCLAPEGKLAIHSTANQDTPFMPKAFGGFGSPVPTPARSGCLGACLLPQVLDRRPEYIEGWWQVAGGGLEIGQPLYDQHRLLNVSAGA